jgi:hypothetical protein
MITCQPQDSHEMHFQGKGVPQGEAHTCQQPLWSLLYVEGVLDGHPQTVCVKCLALFNDGQVQRTL